MVDEKDPSRVNGESKAPRCPECKTGELFRKRLPNGREEWVCLNPECDYRQVLSKSRKIIDLEDGFIDRVGRLKDEQLRAMGETLSRTTRTLTGKARRLARRQLAIIGAEKKRREAESAGMPASGHLRPVQGFISPIPQVPPQLMTPQAKAHRIAGIRNYHQKIKLGQIKSPVHRVRQPSPPSMGPIQSPPYFDRLLRTLREEAHRLEQAARQYSTSPELFPLQIEHRARALELNHVLDLLGSCLEVGDEKEPESTP